MSSSTGPWAGGAWGGSNWRKAAWKPEKLLFLDRYFDDVSMDFNVVDTDVRAEFSAEDIDGKVRFTTGDRA